MVYVELCSVLQRCRNLQYCWVRGVYSTAREYIAESGVYIWQFITAAQRNKVQWNCQFPPTPSSQCSDSAYLVCWTTHGWTASQHYPYRQMLSIISLARQGIVLGPVCIQWVIATSASWTVRLGILLPTQPLFHDRQLLRAARWQASCRSASWPSASSILISSWHEWKALYHVSDSALTAEMFRGSFGGLTIL